MMTVTVKRGDTAEVFTGTLTWGTVPVDLTGASVKFLLKKDAAKYSYAATITSPSAGTVSYAAASGMPSELGDYQQEWEVTFPGGLVQTFPKDDHNVLRIIPDLNPA